MKIPSLLFAGLLTAATMATHQVAAKPTTPDRPSAVQQTDYAAFMADLHLSMNQGQSGLFEQSFLTTPIISKIERRLRLSASERDQLQSDLRLSVKAMAEKIVQGQIKVLRVVDNGANQAKMLIRLDYGTDGLMYIQFDVMKIDHSLRIVDWLNYSTGMNLSDTLQKLYSLQQQLPANDAKSLNQLYLAVKNNQYSDALETLKKLPAALVRHPFVLLLKTEASAVDETLYMQALAEFAERYGSDERYTWIMVDHYYYQQDFNTATRLLEDFANRVVRDAAIYAIQGSFAYVNSDYATAIRFCQQALKLDPDYKDTYLTLLYALIAKHHFDEAVLVLEVMQKRFSYQLDPMTLASFDGFGDFARSRPFLDWAEKTLNDTKEYSETGRLP